MTRVCFVYKCFEVTYVHSVHKVVLTLPQPLPTYHPKIRSGRVRTRATAGSATPPTTTPTS